MSETKTSFIWKRATGAVAAVALAGACAFGLAACSGSGSQDAASGAAAATVNGEAIPEQVVTDAIQTYRDQASFADEDAWGSYLSSTGQTPEMIREQYIQMEADNVLMRQGAAELDASVDSSEVDSIMESMKSGYESDEEWNSWLEEAGYTEESYRAMQETSLLRQAIDEKLSADVKVTDADLDEAAAMIGSSYDGAKRSSQIVFYANSDDEEAVRAKAQDVLDRIRSGSLSFEDAAREYSDLSASADGETPGDAGWSMLTGYTEKYGEALESLELGQVSDVVDDNGTLYIIKVTDVFAAPDEITSVDQLPAAFREIVESSAESQKTADAYNEWLQKLRDSAETVINDMPAGLPYDVDMEKYQPEA